MSKTPWTPGPWRLKHAHEIVDAHGITLVMPHDGSGHVHLTPSDFRLIAAAPEMVGWVQLLERSLIHEIKRDSIDGDDEGARLKTATLFMVRETLAKAGAA